MNTPDMKKPFRIGVLGLGGRIAGVLINVLGTDPRFQIIGYVDPSPTGLPPLQANRIDPGRAFASAQALIAEKPDALFIGSPNHLHLEHITAGLEGGVPKIFSEKPVVVDQEQTWTLAKLLAKHGPDRLLVGLVLRSAPLFRQVMEIIRSGRIGRVVSMEANEHLHPEHGGFIMRDWRRYRKFSGSHILEKCCHDFDLYQAIIGAPGVRAASFGGRDHFVEGNRAGLEGATHDGKQRYHTWGVGWQGIKDVFGSDGDILDNQVAVVEYGNGARLAFHANSHNSLWQRRWLICGTLGAIEADIARGTLRVQSAHAEKPEEITVAGADGHYGADGEMALDTRNNLLDGKPFPVPAVAALRAGLTCMTIDQAQRSGAIVDARADFAKLDALLAGGAAKAGGR